MKALIEEALAELQAASAGVADAEVHARGAAAAEGVAFRAAVNLARRRRLGPFRRAEERAAFRGKDLAAFARAGFSYATAKRVLDAPGPEALEEE